MSLRTYKPQLFVITFMKFRRKLYNSIQLSSQKIKTPPKRSGEIFAQGQRFDFRLLYPQDYHHNRMYEQLPQQNEKNKNTINSFMI